VIDIARSVSKASNENKMYLGDRHTVPVYSNSYRINKVIKKEKEKEPNEE
jgi:hypothetical protein